MKLKISKHGPWHEVIDVELSLPNFHVDVQKIYDYYKNKPMRKEAIKRALISAIMDEVVKQTEEAIDTIYNENGEEIRDDQTI